MSPRQPHKGRGTTANPDGRFEPYRHEAEHDGWDLGAEPDPAPATVLLPDRAKTVITRNESPDVPFDYSVNVYRGCEHGCPYCYARPSHSYLGLSPGLDFETRIFYKPDVARRLEAELAKPGYVCKPINLGANTDPYQPAEKKLRVTRAVLEVLARCRHPVTLVTKSAMVRRDLDLLADMARDNLASVAVSLTSLDNELKRTLEPRTAGPRARLKTMRRLREAGVPVTALIAPVIPAINEPELEDLVAAAADHGATRAGYVLLRLPHEVKDLFREWLDAHHPLRAEHVMSLIRQSRGGRDNDPHFGHRMRGQGPFADLIAKRFHAACRRRGLNREPVPELDTSLFRPPELHGQGRLF